MIRILLSLLVLTLSGCATQTKLPANTTLHSHTIAQNWQLKARMAFKSPEEKFSATLNWQQEKSHSEFRLSKLIGGTLMLLKEQPTGASLEIDDQVYWDVDASRLLMRVTGWEIPVNDIRYWITGQLNPNDNNPLDIKRDETGRIWRISNEEGWLIDYKNYRIFNGRSLPHNLVIKKQDIELKLRVNDWEFSDEHNNN